MSCFVFFPPQSAQAAAAEYIRLFPERSSAEDLKHLLGQIDRALVKRRIQGEAWIKQKKQARKIRKVEGICG